MNKKLFLAGVALLAAVGFTSCNSDTPIDSSNPSGVTPTTARHQVGGDYYDWTAIVKDYKELQDFWKDDQAAVKKLLADKKANTANILIELAGYELKNEVITLPDFWQTGATDGKVVNITFEGTFKNADFERAHAIAKNDVIADMSKFPVKIDANTLKSAEVNFTFDVEKFDLVLNTRDARSTLSGDYTIGYMFANADVKTQDAIEVKAGTIEGLDVTSTGLYKGTIDGVWTRGTNIDAANKDGIQLVNQRLNAKNVFVEANVSIDNDWYANNKWNQFALGTVKFVKTATVTLDNDGSSPTIEAVVGFDASKCFLQTTWNAVLGLPLTSELDNIAAIEKTTVNGNVILIQDVYTDVVFANNVAFETEDVNKFENVTFNDLRPFISADGDVLTFNSVNFWQPVIMTSSIGILEVAKTQSWTYQWIVDNSNPYGGYFKLVDDNNPLLDTNKEKPVVEVNWADYVWNDPALVGVDPAFTGSRLFIANPFTGSNANPATLNKSYVVKVTRIWTVGTGYIPDGVKVVLDDKCKFSDGNVTTTGAALSTTNYALNYVWGAKELYDEQCWYDVNYAGVDHYWKKAEAWAIPGIGPSARFVLTPVAAAAE